MVSSHYHSQMKNPEGRVGVRGTGSGGEQEGMEDEREIFLKRYC